MPHDFAKLCGILQNDKNVKPLGVFEVFAKFGRFSKFCKVPQSLAYFAKS